MSFELFGGALAAVGPEAVDAEQLVSLLEPPAPPAERA